MKLAQKIEWLWENVGEYVKVERTGIKWIGWFYPLHRGYLSIGFYNDYWQILKTSGGETHNRGDFPCIGMRVDHTGRCYSPCRQSVTLWPVDYEPDATDIINHLIELIEAAYDQNYETNH